MSEHATPRPEYPRPDRDRSARWINLNGTWEFRAEGIDTTITVPFAWETPASGVQRTWLEHATYTRTIVVPADWAGLRVVLCFGAVHHVARVSIDDRLVGEHTGGYTSFEYDVTDLLAPGVPSRLTVEVDASADKRSMPHGKQRSIPRDDFDGVCFTPTSGIWQTVWCEARGRTYPATLGVRGDSLTGIELSGQLVGDRPAGCPVTARVLDGDAVTVLCHADADGRFAARLDLRNPRLWSPDDPYLCRVEIVTGEGDDADTLTLPAGLRQVEICGDEIRLNGSRIYLRGVLDQGYWPDTGLTAPTDQALLRDLELARDLGYNLVRKHIKLEDPRWLHHADQMGMLVWAEPPGPSRYSPEAAAAFEAQFQPMFDRDGDHPSIIIWGLYNEEWGLDWDIPGSPEKAQAAAHAYDTLRAIDATRPIIDNSGWAHVKTDIIDWHYYEDDPAAWAENIAALATGARDDYPVRLGLDFIVDKRLLADSTAKRPLVPILNSEYGGGFTSLERAWHLRWQTQELRRHSQFCGYVYTELADVEHESAGLVDTHRQPKDHAGLDLADVNSETVIIVDVIPARAGADIPVPDRPLELTLRISHCGSHAVKGRLQLGWAPAGTPARIPVTPDRMQTDLVTVNPFVVSEPIRVQVPPVDCPSRLQIWFVSDEGQVLARTFLDAGVIEPLNRRGARNP